MMQLSTISFFRYRLEHVARSVGRACTFIPTCRSSSSSSFKTRTHISSVNKKFGNMDKVHVVAKEGFKEVKFDLYTHSQTKNLDFCTRSIERVCRRDFQN